MVKLIIEKGNNHYTHFVLGRADRTKSILPLKWLLNLIVRFLSYLPILKKKHIDLVHLNIPCDAKGICREYATLILSRLAKKPILAHFHGGVFFTEKIENPVLSWIFKRILVKSSDVVVLSELEKAYLQDNFGFGNAIVLYNAVDVQALPFEKTENEIRQILYLGRIDKNKGLKEIIASVRSVYSKIRFRFIVCGDGPERDWFVSECQEIMQDDFSYKGVVCGNDKLDIISHSDIFVLPSYFEGLPVSLLETMGCGVIPVVTSVGSISKVVTHLQNGIIVKKQDAADLSLKLGVLLTDNELMMRLKNNARQSVYDCFDIEKYVANLEQIYQNCL
jgi:glycosyltransferase involved in cell wall biosynthesis